MRGFPLTSRRASPLTRPLASKPDTPPGPPAYVARGVKFPTGAYLFSSGGASGVNSLSVFSFASWLRVSTAPTVNGQFMTPLCMANNLGRGAKLDFIYNTTPGFTFAPALVTSSATTRSYSASVLSMLDGNWHHVMFSASLPGGTQGTDVFLYVDDQPVTITPAGSVLTQYLDNTDRTLGRNNHPSVLREWLGDIADMWVSTSQFLNFGDVAVRRKFITADLRPVDLGDDGTLPTGTQPRIFMRGPAADVGNNRGTLLDWTVNGSPVDSSTNP